MSLISSILGRKAKAVEEAVDNAGQEVTLAVVIFEGNAMVNALIDHSNEVESPRVADLITDVALSMQALYDNLAQDPRDLQVARHVIRRHAPRTVELVKGYTLALSTGAPSENDRAQVEETLGKVAESFKLCLVKCRENDISSLDIESKTLDQLLKM